MLIFTSHLQDTDNLLYILVLRATQLAISIYKYLRCGHLKYAQCELDCCGRGVQDLILPSVWHAPAPALGRALARALKT